MKKPKIVILAGGLGMRLREETEYKPKPMVAVGPHPILWHIMKTYMHHGFNDFIVCIGYKGEMIKDYFLNYEAYNNDFTLEVGKECEIRTHRASDNNNFSVTLVDTGQNSMTGSRVKQIEKYIDTDHFMLTYGDGVADVDVKKLYDFHLKHGSTGTVTGVHPESKFGELIIEKDRVTNFSEKPQLKTGYISGGFFVFKKEMFRYLDRGDNCIFEGKPLNKLASDGRLMIYKHEGFWQCMDTMRDVIFLNKLWEEGKAPWKVWK